MPPHRKRPASPWDEQAEIALPWEREIRVA